MTAHNNIHNQAVKIIKLLKKNGFAAFFVGGYVRSMFLKIESHDIDIATSAKPAQVERILNEAGIRTKPVGKQFGTILALTKPQPLEITTFRKDGEYIDRRHPKTVTFVEDHLQDARRRDFTINALYYDPVAEDIFDPEKGINDLNGGLVRFVGDPKKRINEDALRMLRGVRLAAQLNFKLEKNSFAAIKTRAKYIQSISGERVKAEMDKILSLDNREQGIRLLDQTGLLQFIMPEVWELKTHTHKSRRYHLEGNIFEHALLALKNSPKDLLVSYAALYHDTGKPQTSTPKKKDEGWVNSYPAHEFASADLFLKLAARLRFSRKDSGEIYWIIKMHMKRHSFMKDMADEKKIQIVTHKYFPRLAELWRADSVSNLRYIDDKIQPGIPTAWKEGLKMLGSIRKNRKLIHAATDGNFIMLHANIPASPKISRIKNIITAKIIFNEIKNIRDAKTFLKNI